MHKHTGSGPTDSHWKHTPVTSEPSAPEALDIQLLLRDPELIAEITAYPEGRVRDDFILTALRIGIMALRQAEGQIDSQAVRHEGERLIKDMESHLNAHRQQVTEQIATSLKDYFDPNDGRFPERLERLLRKDGELEQVLRSQVGDQNSVLAKTLGEYLGETSPLARMLGNDAPDSFLRGMTRTLEKALNDDRERILREFSLNESNSALNRLVRELKENHGKLTGNLQDSIKEVVSEFSLDNENSALSRLVNRVENAQKRISAEFSLDTGDSALARMQKELLEVLEQHRKDATAFQQEVRSALAEMSARKEEAARSTTHGNIFEEEMYRVLRDMSHKAGDLASATGNTTGQIRNCKVGDVVVELGPEHVAAGSRIVIEAKDSGGYDLARAREEIELARKNRLAEIGIFVFSRRTAPEGLETLSRYGNDIFTLWDLDDASTDLFLQASVSVARALCSRSRAERADQRVDFEQMDRSIRDIEKQVKGLAEITRLGETIRNNSGKILDRARIISNNLMAQVEVLDRAVDDLKNSGE
ncbi:hypothetical protein [Thiolapillus brandeum]|nr:hypothetical protein [Thiolapillus brandeum]